MDVTIRFWVTNGRIDSFDAFIGYSQRVWDISMLLSFGKIRGDNE